LREGHRAVALKPVARDAVDGPIVETFLALIYARLQMKDDAISLVEGIIRRPGGVDYASDSITVTDLRLRWEWDLIRNDERFEKLTHSPEPNTIAK